MAVTCTSDATAFKRTANLPSSTAMSMWGWFYFTSAPARFWGPLGATAAVDGNNFIQVSSVSSGSTQLQLFWVHGALSAGVTLLNITANNWYFLAITCSGTAIGNVVGYARALTANTLSSASNSSTRDALTLGAVEWGRDSFTGDFIDGRVHACGMADAVLSVDELLELSYYHEPQLDGIRSLNVFYPTIESVNTNTTIDRSGNARNATATVGSLADSPPLLWRAIPAPWNLPGTAASGALTGSSTLTFSQSGTLTGSGALAGSSTLTFSPTSTLTGAGALAGSTTLMFAPTATLAGAGALSGSSTLTFSPTATLTGDGALSGTAAITFSVAGTLADLGGNLAGSSAITFTVVGALTGAGDLAGSTTLTFTPLGTLTDASAPAPSPAGPSPLGGGGGIDYQRIKRNHRRPHRELKSLLDESLPLAYAELTAGPKVVANEARAITEPFLATTGVDWAALESDARAVGRLLALLGRQRTTERKAVERAALQRSDEDWFLMS